jgi:hypothetical protein
MVFGLFGKKKPKQAMSEPPKPEPGMKLEFPSPEDFGHKEEEHGGLSSENVGMEPTVPREADVAAPPLPMELKAGETPEFPLPSMDTGGMAEHEAKFNLSKPKKDIDNEFVEDEGLQSMHPSELRHMPTAEKHEVPETYVEKEQGVGQVSMPMPEPKLAQKLPDMEEHSIPRVATPVQELRRPAKYLDVHEESSLPISDEPTRVVPRQVEEESVEEFAPVAPVIESNIEKLKPIETTPFVLMSSLKAIVNAGNGIKEDTQLSDDICFRLNEVNKDELEKLEIWVEDLEVIEKNLQIIDNRLFS